LPSAAALYGPPELLDAAVALGDGLLGLGMAALFVGGTLVFRLLLRRRRLAEEAVDEDVVPGHPPPAHEFHEAPSAARAHLR
jgi:hypothetical protein